MIVARLRIAGTRPDGIAIVDAGKKRQLVVRLERDRDARCCERVRGPAARQVVGGNRRPPPRTVDERATTLGKQELRIRSELVETD